MGVNTVRFIFELVRVFFSQIIFELVAGISCIFPTYRTPGVLVSWTLGPLVSWSLRVCGRSAALFGRQENIDT